MVFYSSKKPHRNKVSIVTAVFNRKNLILGALESVRLQSYGSIEHIIIDGESDDGTQEIIQQHLTNSMLFISEPDSGIYDAINKGIKKSTGDIIGLMHSDDRFKDQSIIEKVVAAFEDPKVEAVFGDLQYISKDSPERIVRHWRTGSFSLKKLKNGWMPPHPTLFLRRSVFDKYGYYDTNFKISADYDFILRCLKSGELNTVYIPEVLVKMSLGGESNRSISNVIRKTKEDYDVVVRNNIGGLTTIILKNIRKVNQFF